jgi:hypothetical protein
VCVAIYYSYKFIDLRAIIQVSKHKKRSNQL